MRKFVIALLILLLIPVAYVGALTYSHADLSALPPLESGDLIFDTTLTNQTPAILLATGSLYTHVGIIHKQRQGGYTVIHAGQHVIETSLESFIRSGWGERITLLRYPGLNDSQRDAIVNNAQSYIGRPYNYVFYMKSNEIYCSQLPYLVFQTEHVPIGREEKIGSLHVNNSAVHALFEKRWKQHPACQKPGMDYESCWKAVLDEPIVTPVSLAHDPKLSLLYTNYLF